MNLWLTVAISDRGTQAFLDGSYEKASARAEKIRKEAKLIGLKVCYVAKVEEKWTGGEKCGT